jgi:hypothetical protein
VFYLIFLKIIDIHLLVFKIERQCGLQVMAPSITGFIEAVSAPENKIYCCITTLYVV